MAALIDRTVPPPSPCNCTCVVDRKQSWCVGCLRTLEEIGMWEQMTPRQQWDIIDKIAVRRAAVSKHGA